MNPLTISFIQDAIVWQNPKANRDHFSKVIESNAVKSDLILLPEMFTTGFSQQSADLAESMDGDTVKWMQDIANKFACHIAGSVVIREGDNIYNRLLWVTETGDIHSYDKRHLFSFAGEDKVYAPGKKRTIVELNGWRLCPQVCYDLRFPVWSRNQNDYDVLIYVANWPQVRVSHWQQLLVGRAIENLAYVIGVNRLGEDGHGYPHNGQSIALDAKGKVLTEAKDKAGCYSVTLDYEELKRYREKFGALEDGDDFSIKM